MIGMSLKDAIELNEVPLVERYPPEDILSEDGLYCYLLQPEEHNNQHKRAMDRIWSKATYSGIDITNGSREISTAVS